MKKSEILQQEIDWFNRAHKNSENKGFTLEFRNGFETAIGWLRLHRDIALSEESSDRQCHCEVTEHVPNCPSWGV